MHASPLVDATMPDTSPELLTTIHRGPVTALDGRVVGYTVTVVFETAAAGPGGADLTVPTQQGRGHVAAPVVPQDVLHAAYLDLDLVNLVADRYVFLPATPQMLQGFLPTPAAPGRLVLDLPRGFENTPDAVERANALTGLGARLCLVGYRDEPAQAALLPHLAFVVVDALDDVPLAPLVHHVHASGTRVLVMGANLPELQDSCRAAGVDALRRSTEDRFQVATAAPSAATPAVERPSSAGSRVLRAGEQQCLAVVHLLNEPDVNFAAVAQVIDTDPVLTLRVLHLVNSGAFALRQEIDTVQQAVVLLGRREVTTLVTALMLDARPDAMDRLWFILARALTCELLADDAAGYTVGMLSALSDQLGVPVEAVLESVGVSQAVAAAVLAHEGQLGWVLAAVRAHERQDTTGVLSAGMQPSEVSSVYVQCLGDALATARAVTREP